MIDLSDNSLSFKDKWKIYTTNYWTKIYSFIHTSSLFPIDTIILWGCIPYSEYEQSFFFKENPILVTNQQLTVYFYMRKLPSNEDFYFFFVNTIGNKNILLQSYDRELTQDHLLLKRLYQNNLSINKIFLHPYSFNCWSAICDNV